MGCNGQLCMYVCIECVQLYFTNGFTNIILSNVNCLWLVVVTLIFDGSPQIIVQRCQIAAPRWPNDINSADDNTTLKNRVQSIECSFGCVARSAKLNLQIFVSKNSFSMAQWRSPLTVTATSCSFSKKYASIMPLYQNPQQTVTRFGSVGFKCGFSVPQVWLFTYSPRSKWASSKKMIFFVKISIFCKSIAGTLSEKKMYWMTDWL